MEAGKRYQVAYTKGNAPLSIWRYSIEATKDLANLLRKAGYFVTVWEHTKDGSRMTEI